MNGGKEGERERRRNNVKGEMRHSGEGEKRRYKGEKGIERERERW